MAKKVIKFSRTDTGKTILDIVWDFCKTISTATTVSTSGSSTEELGYGEYVLTNPNIIEDTAFSVSLSGSPSTYYSDIFSLSDGNLATKDDTSGILYTITGDADINVIAGTILSGDYTHILHYDNLRMEIQELDANPSLRIDFTFRTNANKLPSKFTFQGRYEHGGANPKDHHCDIYAYNYNTASYDLISDETNELLHLPSSTTDYNREFPLGIDYVEASTGNILIRIDHDPVNFGDTDDRLWINKVSVTSLNYATLSIRDMIVWVPPFMADAVWDEVLTGSAHNTNGTAGKILKTVGANVVYTGVVVSTTNNTITLDAGASINNGAYDPSTIAITTGVGAGQCRLILQYDGTTQTAVVDRNWKYLPQAGDSFVIFADAGREHVNEGLITGVSGSGLYVQLNANASNIDNVYNGQVIFFRSGTGEDQAFRIVSYDGTNKIVTLCDTPGISPDTTTAYVILPSSVLRADILAQGLLANGIASQVTSNDILAKLLEIFYLYGLDPTKPLIVSTTQRTAGDITQNITTDETGTTTVIRV